MSNISVMFDEETIEKRIREMAAEIDKDYDEPVLLICVLKGASVFTCELAKRITVPVFLDFIRVSSYGSGTESSGVLKFKKDVEEEIEGRNVIIIEDIIDSGRTLSLLKKKFSERGAKSVRIAVLLDKPDRRVVFDAVPDYCGFKIPDAFVVGYGLDYDEKYRNLPYVGVLSL